MGWPVWSFVDCPRQPRSACGSAVRHRRSLEAEVRALLERAAQGTAVPGAEAERFPDWFIRMTRAGIDLDEAIEEDRTPPEALIFDPARHHPVLLHDLLPRRLRQRIYRRPSLSLSGACWRQERAPAPREEWQPDDRRGGSGLASVAASLGAPGAHVTHTVGGLAHLAIAG